MKRLDHDFAYQWHRRINQHSQHAENLSDWPGFMYHGKQMADEVPRMAMLFMLERTGGLPNVHQQCSHSRPEPVPDNHLTCCLGVACRECPYLKALDTAVLEPEQIDLAKAWTCAAHILENISQVDASEGFVLTTDDRMYWQNVYQSLASAYYEEEE